MTQCDETFQKIQALQQRKRQLERMGGILANAGGDVPDDPAKRFAFRDKETGDDLEMDFDDVFQRNTETRDDLAEGAARAAGRRATPIGSEGQFENFAQLIDRMGFDSAKEMGALLQRMTNEWGTVNPEDYTKFTRVNSREEFEQNLSQAFYEARVDIEQDQVAQAIARNAAPFYSLLDNQLRLQTLSDVTRANFLKKVQDITKEIQETGLPPSRDTKVATMDAYAKAIFGHRSLRVAKRRTGQALQQWQRVMDEDPGLPTSVYRETADQAAKSAAGETADLADRIVMGPQEMISEDSLIRKVVEAAEKGPDGVRELEEIQLVMKMDGIDPMAPVEDGFENTWRRHARAAYKDSILFAPKSQIINNYLSQKVVFLAEGFKKAVGQGYELLPKKETQGELFNPLATEFYRTTLKAQLDGARIAGKAALVAEDVIKQTWKESFMRGVFDNDVAFAGNIDNFASKSGTVSIDQQYKIAEKVLSAPVRRNLNGIFDLRDKLHTGLKVLANDIIEKRTGVRLPIYSALQTMTAVDARAGLRVYMTQRANDLMMEAARQRPDLSLAQWAEMASAQMDDQLYQMTPTPQNIKDYRVQFKAGPEISDDEIAAHIALEKAGLPVLATKEQIAAKDMSVFVRMQHKPEKGFMAGASKAVEGARSSAKYGEVVDAMVSFWRQPSNALAWDISLASPHTPVLRILEVAGAIVKGQEVTPLMAARAQSAAVVWISLFAAFDQLDKAGQIVGSGPLDQDRRKAWEEKLRAEGKVPNSIFGIPFNMGGIPVLNSMFLMRDIKRIVEEGQVSRWDQSRLAWDAISAGAGTIMRMPGFRTLQMFANAVTTGGEAAFQKLFAFTMNSQSNPASGVMRTAEGLAGTSRSDLVRPKRWSRDDQYTIEQLAPDHPLRQLNDSLRKFAYDSQPGVAALMGLPIRTHTYLGVEIRRPDGIFKGDWPIGIAGIGRDGVVEAWLDSFGMLDPGPTINTQKMWGVPVDEILINEFNNTYGQIKAPKRLDPSALGPTTWQGRAGMLLTSKGLVERTKQGVNMTRFIQQLTAGRTLREALNELRVSKTWAEWDADPETTTDPRVNDRPRSLIQRGPGPWLVKQLHNYYEQLAIRNLRADPNPTPSNQQWREDLNNRVGFSQDVRPVLDALSGR